MNAHLPDDFDHRAFEACYGDPCTRDLSEIAIPYCLAKLAYAAGEDEAGDAAYGRFIDLTDSDEREQIEAQLEYEFSSVAAWASCLENEAAHVKHETAKVAVFRAIAAFGARSAWVPVIAEEAAQGAAA